MDEVPDMIILVWDTQKELRVRLDTVAGLLPEQVFRLIEAVAEHYEEEETRLKHTQGWLEAQMRGGPAVEPSVPDDDSW